MRSSPSLPLALIHAATLAEREFPVEIFDRRLHGAAWEAELEASLRDEPLLVGATAFTGPMIRSCIEMCEVVRRVRPRVPIVWGGIHASLLPEQTAHSPFADFVVQGEGEVPLRDLARALAEGRSPREIPGLWCRDGERVVAWTPAPKLDLSALPAPPWHLVDMSRYQPTYKGRKSAFFQSSRGCPLPCTYCYNVVFNDRRWRALDPTRTLEQIHRLVGEFGIEDIYFVDDMFFTNLKRARAIAEGLKSLGITWQVQGVDIEGMARMTDDDYQLIVDSGCRRLTCGIESGSPRLRTYVQKGGTVDDVVEVTERLARYPITLFYSFMCGIPTETLDELRMTVDLMLKLLALNHNVHVSPLYNFTPYPGTALFDVAMDAGLEAPATLEGWADFRHERTNLMPERKALYESIYFTSLFLDDKAREYGAPWAVRALAKAYQPIARFRTANLFFHGLIERSAMNLALSVWGSVGRNFARHGAADA